MKKKSKEALRDLCPPMLWRFLGRLSPKRSSGNRWQFGAEQPSEFYDQTFDENEHWKQHYTASRYYPIWTVIADRLRPHNESRVLDIGCGPGQVACFLRDLGIPSYLGLDFSDKRIEHAKRVCPEFEFDSADVFKTDKIETADYNTILVMEFLEHIESDKEVIQRFPAGKRVIATVPNFAATGHVRYFSDAAEVESRYSDVLLDLQVDSILEDSKNKTYFLLEGTAAG